MAHHVLHNRWPSLASNCQVRLITRRCEYCGEQAGLSPDFTEPTVRGGGDDLQ